MERAQFTSKIRLAIALTGVLGAGSLAFAAATPAAVAASSGSGGASPAAKCVPNPNAICPEIFAPVTCNNGKTYSNQCFADADCAKGCVSSNPV